MNALVIAATLTILSDQARGLRRADHGRGADRARGRVMGTLYRVVLVILLLIVVALAVASSRSSA